MGAGPRRASGPSGARFVARAAVSGRNAIIHFLRSFSAKAHVRPMLIVPMDRQRQFLSELVSQEGHEQEAGEQGLQGNRRSRSRTSWERRSSRRSTRDSDKRPAECMLTGHGVLRGRVGFTTLGRKTKDRWTRTALQGSVPFRLRVLFVDQSDGQIPGPIGARLNGVPRLRHRLANRAAGDVSGSSRSLHGSGRCDSRASAADA